MDKMLTRSVKLKINILCKLNELQTLAIRIYRKSDPGNKAILGLESDPKSKRARFKLILAN